MRPSSRVEAWNESHTPMAKTYAVLGPPKISLEQSAAPQPSLGSAPNRNCFLTYDL